MWSCNFYGMALCHCITGHWLFDTIWASPYEKGNLPHRRTAKAQASLHIRAVSPEPSLLAHAMQGISVSFGQKSCDSKPNHMVLTSLFSKFGLARYTHIASFVLTCRKRGARWLSGRVSDSGARGPGFETYRRRVVSLSKTLYSPKVLVNYPGSDGSVPIWLKNCWLGR